jgi:hypothetical protein
MDTQTTMLNEIPDAAWPFHASNAAAFARATPPLPGQLWPEQGGLYAGVIVGDDGKPYHLIALQPQDYHGVIGPWGEYGKEIKGASSERDGLPNTDAMVAAGSEIATATRALAVGGHDDWYIASRHEASLAYIHTGAGDDIDGDPDYWTSTQCSAHYAWDQHFADGTQYYWSKGSKLRARVVRRLLAD